MLDPALGVDIIVGGHSHTFIDEPARVNDILVVQAGTGTDQIGRFDLEIDTDRNCIHSFRWQSIPITEANCPKDLAMEDVLNHYKVVTDNKYSRMVTRLKRRLSHPSRYRETELGNLFADILQESLRLDVMLLGSGSVRGTELGPIVLLSDLTECFPYDDTIHLLRITGAQLKEMIRFMLRDEVWAGSHCEFYQFSQGMRVVYDRSSRSFKEFSLNGEPVADDRIYQVGLQHYHFVNIESFFGIPLEEVSRNGAPKAIATSCFEIIDEYLSSQQNLDREVCGRLVVE